MRLWTLHPRHLDAAGLVALWRESLLAQAVLLGRTRGYTRHPQLHRFRAAAEPVASIAGYLRVVAEEATSRGYAFDTARIVACEHPARPIAETRGQLLYEWEHLGRKLERRSPEWYRDRVVKAKPTPHPSFRIVAGGVRDWERISDGEGTRARGAPSTICGPQRRRKRRDLLGVHRVGAVVPLPRGNPEAAHARVAIAGSIRDARAAGTQAVGAEAHANADLVRPRAHRERQHARDAHGRDDDGERAE